MFEITRGTGFKMTFANGWTISVQFGGFNYCDNRYPGGHDEIVGGFCFCPNAEVAVIKPDGSFAHISDCDDIMGWQTPEQVFALMARIAEGTVYEYERAND